MKRCGWVLLFVVAGGVSGCETPTVPLSLREEDLPYNFRLRLPVAGPDAAGTDTLTFHWGRGSTVPVFIVESSGGGRPALGPAFRHAAEVWNAAALFGEVRLRETAELSRARVVLGWSDGERVVEVPEGCVGPTMGGAASTQGCIVEGRDAEARPVKRLQVWPRVDGEASQVGILVSVVPRPDVVGNVHADTAAARVRRLVTHEMGHALGILDHSPNPRDLMWSGLMLSDTLTRADRVTLRTLYQARRDVLP